mmetsp:Transcript_41565/g.75334  ORF Transcript_41565/g.75334 Transcript_41565/m.75334 type:complete len:160 (-) Transcript_41565:79-558(-)
MTSILRRLVSIREWYSELTIGEKGFMCFAVGNVSGTFYGTYKRRGNMRPEQADWLVVTTYHVDEKKRKNFEANWSDMARLAQRQPGYEWTRTYKALDWQDSPFQYITFRMWDQESSYRRFIHGDPTLVELKRRMTELCRGEKSAVYRTQVDDSIARIIL